MHRLADPRSAWFRRGLGTSAALSRTRDVAPLLSVAPEMRAVSQMSAANARTRLEAPHAEQWSHAATPCDAR